MKNILYFLLLTVILFSGCSGEITCPDWTSTDDSIMPYKNVNFVSFKSNDSIITTELNPIITGRGSAGSTANKNDCFKAGMVTIEFKTEKNLTRFYISYENVGIQNSIYFYIQTYINNNQFIWCVSNPTKDDCNKFREVYDSTINGVNYKKILAFLIDSTQITFPDPNYKTYVSKIYYAFGTGIVQFEQENPHQVWTLVRE